MSEPLDREELREAFRDARGKQGDEAAAGRRVDEMAVTILLLLEYAAGNAGELAFVANAFGNCFGYLKSNLPGAAFERLRVAFRHDENGVML